MTDAVGMGELIRQFRPEFPDLTVSKVRFLESQGILRPSRTPAGYRKFTEQDCERLRYALRAQRDHFLPLKVIGEHLDAIERGLEPPALHDPSPRPPVKGDDLLSADVMVNEAELRRESGLDDEQVAEAIEHGLLGPNPEGMFPASDIEAARAIKALAHYGLTARHLRAARLAADRIAGIVDQSVQAARPGPDGPQSAALSVSAAADRLTSALLARHVLEQYGRGGS